MLIHVSIAPARSRHTPGRAFFPWQDRRGFSCLDESEDVQNGLPTRPQPKTTPEAYPLGYVEDVVEART
jgi:hypothetical protein